MLTRSLACGSALAGALLLVACISDGPGGAIGSSGAGAAAENGGGGVSAAVGGSGGAEPSASSTGGAVPSPCPDGCGEGAECDEDAGACVCSEGFYGDEPASGCEPVPLLEGWIGSPCDSHADCDYEGGVCQPEAEGYPWGHCTEPCETYCPDASGYPTTFCIEPLGETGGSCVARCDLDAYPFTHGCRPGYTCMSLPRNGESSTVRPVCAPKSWLGDAPCADLSNAVGDDDCYFELVSFGDTMLEAQARELLAGDADETSALAFLDGNFAASQAYIENELELTIHSNYTSGHSSAQPMSGAIVHYTAYQSENKTIAYFVSSDPHASTHFMIGSARNGQLVQLFSHENRTWHAGSTYNVDRFGIDFANSGYLVADGDDWLDYADRVYTMWLPLHGDQAIEVTGGIPGAESKFAGHDYWQPYTYYQMLTYVLVGRALHLVYDLDPADVERHGDVAASRVDPGPQLAFTYLNELLFNDADVFDTDWLDEYKVEPDWIATHPEAR